MSADVTVAVAGDPVEARRDPRRPAPRRHRVAGSSRPRPTATRPAARRPVPRARREARSSSARWSCSRRTTTRDEDEDDE